MGIKLKPHNSFEDVMHKLKSGEISGVDFNKWIGFRGVTVSEQDMTVEQKSFYGNLINKILQEDLSIEDVYDIDGLNEAIETLNEQEEEVLKMRYGLDGEKPKTLAEIGKHLNKSRGRISQIELKALRKIRWSSSRKKLFIVDEEKEKLEDLEYKYKQIQDDIRVLSTIKAYFLDENGNPKQNLKNTDLSNFRTFEVLFEHDELDGKTILDLIKSLEKDEKKYDLQTDIRVEELNLSTRAFNLITRTGIFTVRELIQMTKDDLGKIRGMGSSTQDEIVRKVEELGLHFAVDTEKKEKHVEIKKTVGILDTRIETMGLSTRAFNCIARTGNFTLRELIQMKEEDLYHVRNAGIGTVEEVVRKVNEYGFKMGCTEEEIRAIQEEENHRIEEEKAFQEEENNKIKEEDILNLIKLCDSKIEGYSKDAEDIKREIDRIRSVMERCKKAREFYFNEENILNPNAIIPGIPNVGRSVENVVIEDIEITGQKIGEASYDVTIEECDAAQAELEKLKATQKGDGSRDE